MNYHNITYPDMNNGEGLRVCLWLSGCSHCCNGCQNPQTWNPHSGIKFDESAEKELLKELGKDYISGLTLSGGDPLYKDNLEEVCELVHKVKKMYPEKTIWLYTGYEYQILIDEYNTYRLTPFASSADEWLTRFEILLETDVLIDGKYINSLRNIALEWVGSSNQRVIDVQKSLKENKVILYETI